MRWMLLLTFLGACGPGKHGPDNPDGDPGGGEMPSLHGPIEVTVLAEFGDVDGQGDQLPIGMPLQGAPVFFIHADGSYELVATAGDGKARSSDVDAPTTVIVKRPQGTDTALTVYVGVPPLVPITAGPKPGPSQTLIGSVTFKAPDVPGAKSYRYSAPCIFGPPSTPNATNTFDVLDPCERTQRVVALEVRDPSGAILGFSQVIADITPGGSVVLPAPTPQVAFVGTVTNVPAIASQVDVVAAYYDGDQVLTDASAEGPPSGGSATLSMGVSPVGTSMVVTAAVASTTSTTGYLNSRHIARSASLVPSATVDLGGLLKFVSFATWDTATLRATWTTDGTGGDGDLVYAHGEYFVGAHRVQMRFFGPPGPTSIGLPNPLPAELASLMPGPTDSGTMDALMLIDDVARDGYAALVTTADADSRSLASSTYGDAAEVWISGSTFF